MKKSVIAATKVAIGAIALAGSTWSHALAYTGQDPIITYRSCSFAQVTAQLRLDGGITYNVMGTCGGAPITGQLAYGGNQQMKEQFIYGGSEIRSTAICPADPWTTGVACHDQQVSAKRADPGQLINQPVPLSRFVANAAQVFQTARANAAKPNPPGPPVNLQAVTRGLGNNVTAVITWLRPDEQPPNGPFLDFVVEARPVNAQGAAWTRLGGMPKHPALNYSLAIKLPPPVPGTAGWELRACSTTMFANTCTAPLIPEFDKRIIQQFENSAMKEMVKPGAPNMRIGAETKSSVAPLANQPVPPALTQPIAPSQAGSLNQQPLPPKSLPRLTQPPTPGQASALNPQPLPPKALTAPALRPSIMRRGVPQEDTLPAETKPMEAPAP
jgi:hypothetical protein